MSGPILILLIYAILLIVIGVFHRASTSSSEFHIASRKVGVVRFLLATFTLIGAGELVTLTALSYAFGFWALTFFAGVTAGFIVLAFLAGRARKNAAENDHQSLPDYFFSNFGRAASILATTLNVVSLGALLLIQYVVGGLMLNIITGLPIWLCITIMAVAVGLYVLLGGFRSVLTTDAIQGILMFLGIVILLVSFSVVSFIESAQSPPEQAMIPLGDGMSLVLLGFFAVIGAADVWQRVLSTRDNTTARRGLLLSAAAWTVFGVLAVSFAMLIMANYPEADPNSAFFVMLADLPQWLATIAALFLFSILVSTADIELFVISVLLNKEISRKSGKELSPNTTRYYILAIAIISGVAAIFFQQFLDIYFFLLYLLMIVGPVALARLLGRGSPMLALIGMLGGIAVLIMLSPFVLDKLSGAYQLLIVLPPLCAFLGSSSKGNHHGRMVISSRSSKDQRRNS